MFSQFKRDLYFALAQLKLVLTHLFWKVTGFKDEKIIVWVHFYTKSKYYLFQHPLHIINVDTSLESIPKIYNSSRVDSLNLEIIQNLKFILLLTW